MVRINPEAKVTLSKTNVGYLVAGIVFGLGLLLRFQARSLAWPERYSFSGDRANTPWAYAESLLIDLSLLMMLAGVLIFTVAFARWMLSDEKPGPADPPTS